jgi:hypothetical protein
MSSLRHILMLLLFPALTFAATQKVNFKYYTEPIELRYETDLIPELDVRANDESISAFYKTLEKTDYRSFLLQISSYKKRLELNGYLEYDLIHKAVNSICIDKNGNYKTVLEWFLLSKADYDARLTHVGQAIFLYAYITENVYNVPIIQINGRDYISLTSIKYDYGNIKNSTAYKVNFIPNPEGKSLSFDLAKLPTLQADTIHKKIRFSHRYELYQFDVVLDKSIIDLMKDYPLVDELYYLETPISKTLHESLVKKLEELIAKKDKEEAVKVLLSLTRNFEYKTDEDNFGRNKPMIPDEVLFYSQSDCEDRSALFYALMKELVKLPTIIVDYPEHLTVGVSLPQNKGKPLMHKGKCYTICDPTGPNNTYEVGIYPEGYELLPYQITLSFE